jgi:CRP-like cAMP-binding protein
MTGLHSARENHLLAALPALEMQRLYPQLEETSLRTGDVLYEPGVELRHVYFPTTSIVSIVHAIENGSSTEVAIVGNEGIIGVPLFMGGDAASSRAIVQSAGHAFRMPGRHIKEAFIRGGAVQSLLLRYTQSLIAQMAQTAVCNRHHSLKQQLCRRLLMNLDRLPSNEMRMTQEWIANMLGVRREGVTESAGRLQKLGMIHYSRGHIVVLDRPALETETCECYGIVKRELHRLLPLGDAMQAPRISDRRYAIPAARVAAPGSDLGAALASA